MCPSCARLVARRDKFCDHCNTDLRKMRPQRVQGTKTTIMERLRSPWAVWLLASAFFFVFAHVASSGPDLARAYMWTLVLSLGFASAFILAIKASQGLEELIDYCWDGRWFFRDDPLDKWVCVILILFLEGLTFMHLIIRPGMPPGSQWWP
jgi:hypothetical protein